MFVVVKISVYGHESGGTVSEVYGPFATREEAKAFADEDIFGIEFEVHDLIKA